MQKRERGIHRYIRGISSIGQRYIDLSAIGPFS